MKDIYCIGGDQRMFHAVKYLSEHGYACRTYHVPGFEDVITEIPNGSIVILPFPSVKGGTIADLSTEASRCIGLFRSGNILIGGHFSDAFSEIPPQDVRLIDVSMSEPFLMNNAALSAECALGKTIVSSPFALRGSHVLVMGWGRIGKHLTYLLSACGADVAVYVRKPSDSAYLRSMQITTLSPDLRENDYHEFQCIFNTVPVPVIDLSIVKALREDCLYYELASLPGGLCKEAIGYLGERRLPLPGLPGKYAPAQAGTVYAQEILRRLEEIKCKSSQPSALP